MVASRGELQEAIIKDNNKSGAELKESKFIVTRNVIQGNGGYGLFVDQFSEVEVSENYINENGGFNVRLEKSHDIYR